MFGLPKWWPVPCQFILEVWRETNKINGVAWNYIEFIILAKQARLSFKMVINISQEISCAVLRISGDEYIALA